MKREQVFKLMIYLFSLPENQREYALWSMSHKIGGEYEFKNELSHNLSYGVTDNIDHEIKSIWEAS